MSKTVIFTAAVAMVIALAIGFVSGMFYSSGKLETFEQAKNDVVSKLEQIKNSMGNEISALESTKKQITKQLVSMQKNEQTLRKKLQELESGNTKPSDVKIASIITATKGVKNIVKLVDYKILHQRASLNKIHVYLQFKNKTDKTLVGLVYDLTYYDNFGTILYTQKNLEQALELKPGKKNRRNNCKLTYIEAFETGSYAKMESDAKAGTLKLKVKIHEAAFDDGSVVRFN